MATPLSACSYAVVDCETTGLFPGAHHRMVELAIICLDGLDATRTEWVTLLDPERDLGDAGIHGIRGRDIRDAPRFQEVVGSVLELLRGRVIVAHNARFDCGFLAAELGRTGYSVAPLPSICTIEMAHRLTGGAGGWRLSDCCREVGITVDGAEHQAASDARLCADLFCALAAEAMARGCASLADFGCLEAPDPDGWPTVSSQGICRPRHSKRAASKPAYLEKLVARRSGVVGAPTAETSAYLELLDRALEDRMLTGTESAELASVAELYGLTGEQLAAVHGRYIDSLCLTALADGTVTDREMYDLRLVAESLGIHDLDRRLGEDPVSSASEAPVAGPVDVGLVGKRVCFTGKLLCTVGGQELTRERAAELATAAGLVVEKRVTHGLDLLVVADPETQSGKARKAREYGVRIVAESAFWQMIGVTVK